MALPPDDPPPGVPEWVVTYGDMMSLLLTFFIMLVSMSELKDQGKIRLMMDALQERFGPTADAAGVPGRSLQTNSAFTDPASAGSTAEGGLEAASRDASGRAGPHSPARRIGHQNVPTLGGTVAFGRFEAAPEPASEADLDRLAAALASQTHSIMIRGHASPEPLPADGPFADAWDLSYARAAAVARRLAERGLDEGRLVVSAAGDTEPRRRGPQEAQADNHRVDVFLFDSYKTPAAPSGPASGPR